MTSVEHLKLLLNGERLNGHFMMPLVKQFCTIQTGQLYGRYSQDHRVLTSCQLEVIRRFPVDIFNVLGYPYREAADCGLKVTFPEDSQPSAEGVLIKGIEDLDRIDWPDPLAGRLMSDRIRAIGAFKEARPDIVAMGTIEGPFAQVNTFMGIQRTMVTFFDNPDLLRKAIAWMEPREIRFALAQIEAGADMMFVGSSLASQVGPRLYREFLVEPHIRVVRAIQQTGVPVRFHICGDINPIMDQVARTGARFIDVDYPVDIADACEVVERVSPGSYVVGNVDPVAVLLRGTAEDVRNACIACERQAEGFDNFILAPGCEISPATPVENYRALIEFGWKFKSVEK